ncbi:MAG: hypothetical protein WKF89_03460 [Chitinophagaceae bacterium]
MAGINPEQSENKPDKPLIQATIRTKNGEERSLVNSLENLWQHETRHAVLFGDGGMGKTVSLIHLWDTLLKTNSEIVPVFLTLNEYNQPHLQKEDFIAKRIARHYLGETTDKTIDDIWEAWKIEKQPGTPNMILLLDGYNEITVDRRQLILELNELRLKGKAVQILVTSRYEMDSLTWSNGFHSLALQPLDANKLRFYLASQNLRYPEDERLLQILQNPMMLTLYANANEIIDQYKEHKQFNFKPRITTQGELLWNFLEAQQVRLSKIYGDDTWQYYYCKFLIRHFLPYLGYEMEKAGQFSIDKKQLKSLINDACKYFYREEFIEAYPDYNFLPENFNLEPLGFRRADKRFEQISKSLCGELSLTKQNGKYFLPQGHSDSVTSVAFHPDGNSFISGSSDSTIKAWNLLTGECTGTFQGHSDWVSSVAFHPDGNSFISGSSDHTIKAWDLLTGECISTMKSVGGLLLAGCSFRNLHPGSQFTPEGKDLMRQYGAIFDEADQEKWNTAIEMFDSD